MPGTKLLPLFVLFAGWEVVSGTVVPTAMLPPLSSVVVEAVSLWTSESAALPLHLRDTLFRSGAGILVASIVGVPLGIAMARSALVRRSIEPIVRFVYPSPKSPLIPLLIFWLGIGNLSRIVLAVAGSLLPILLSTMNGVDELDRELLWSARTMGISRVRELYEVVLPGILPTVLTGVRIGMIFSFAIVISSEMILARSGIGVLVVQYSEYGQYTRMFATVLWSVAVVAVVDRLYLAVSRYALRWSDRTVNTI